MLRRLSPLLLLGALAVACNGRDEDDAHTDETDQGPPPPPLVPGAPVAGAAEGTLKLPVGTPLAAFTSRCGCLGGTSRKDSRTSHYATTFMRSTGVHTRPTIKVVWISNGDKHLVLTKTDLGYAFDGVVDEVTKRLEEATGEDLGGQVTWSTNHSHSSYGTFSANEGFYLGSDRFNRENFERIVQQITDVALDAYAQRRPAALGFGARNDDWDPGNRVYSDRRGDNNDLRLFEDMGPEQAGKDPHMHLLRVDEADSGKPIAIVFGWGMHPITFGETSSLATADATAHAEQEVAESFDHPVVAVYLQTATGDASVRGRGDGWERTESVGVFARDAILELWEQTPTVSEPILLETHSRAVPMNGRDIHVTRNGKVDWKYPPFDPAKAESHRPDNIIFDEDGSIRPDFDEWYTDSGAVFCGSGDFDLPVGGLPNVASKDRSGECEPGKHCNYGTCMQVGFMKLLVESFFFAADALPEGGLAMPLDGMTQTYTAAARLGPIGVRGVDGATGADDVLLSFFPGEPLHFYTETWRRRVKEQLGLEHTALFGYSMDHEGYLLVAEDWFSGGYEPDISIWGPLSGEWIMENVLAYGESVLGTDLAEPFDPKKGAWTYKDHPFPNKVPDVTPNAGHRFTSPEDAGFPEYLWVPDNLRLDLRIHEEIPRLNGMVQVAWEGGDAAVDDPRITLEREVSEGVWEPARTRGGRPINDDLQDFVIGYTPDPLFPASANQKHYWWAAWQSVGHVTPRDQAGPHDRAGVPEGTYRLKVEGRKFRGNDTEFPWDSDPYEFTTPSFRVVPAPVSFDEIDGGVRTWLQAHARGFRLIDVEGNARGANPLRGSLEVVWQVVGEDPIEETIEAPAPQDGKTFLPFPAGKTVVSVTVTDRYGNTGRYDRL